MVNTCGVAVVACRILGEWEKIDADRFYGRVFPVL